ncbi:MAG: acetate--CoA ligase family protein [Dethiobacteria bacterium]
MTDIAPNRRKDLEPFFKARSIAVIGASPHFNKPNGRPLQSLLNSGYKGTIYPVNPNYRSIADLICYPSIKDIPGQVELAVVVVPAAGVLPMLYQCAEKGVKGAVVITSGFSETGEQGRQLEVEMAKLARRSGMRIMGPNCLGMINNLNGLWASFAHLLIQKEHYYERRFSLISQSGFFGAFIYRMAGQEKLAFNHFASVGNQADLNFTDFLEYMIEDPAVEIISGYIEGLKDGGKFLATAREALARRKPFVAMKVGRTGAGARAASSHTGSLAGIDRIYDAAFNQAGIIRADSLEKLLAALTLFATERRPHGPRVAIISTSGGGAVILSDECEQHNLEVVEFTPETRRELDEVLPFFASSANPVDLTAQIITEPDLLLKCFRLVEADPNVDMIIVSLHVSYELARTVTETMVELYQQVEKPVLAIGYPFGDIAEVEKMLDRMRSIGLPVIKTTDNGIWAISMLMKWLQKTGRIIPPDDVLPGPEREAALQVFRSLPKNRKHLTEFQAASVLRAYGIDIPEADLAFSSTEAMRIADRLGYPVVLKIQSPDILHKTDVGGLAVNLNGSEEVEEAYRRISSTVGKKAPGVKLEGMLVQKMLPPGREVIVGVKQDAVFGPVIMFGVGGIFVEVLEDVSFKVAPLTRDDATDMIREIRGYPLLAGTRGEQPSDLAALEDILLKISRLALELKDEIEEMDINPLLVFNAGEGVAAVDALITRKNAGGKQ